MRFWDASALVPLLVAQSASARMRRAYRVDPEVVVWWGTKVQCDSAVARLEREGLLSLRGAGEALHRVDVLSARWHEIQPTDQLRDSARRLLRTHALRAGDSLQLAAALVAAEQRAGTLAFIGLDDRLLQAAQREGMAIVD